MKTILILLTAAMLSLSASSFTSCTSTGGVSGTISSAQAWLNDPKNQAMINSIAQTAISLIGMFGKRTATTDATVVGSIAKKPEYSTVPAGAIKAIAANPHAYIKN
jgi:hypothetical protein